MKSLKETKTKLIAMYKKILINGEETLPKEEGRYFVGVKDNSEPQDIFWWLSNTDAPGQADYWMNTFDWYLIESPISVPTVLWEAISSDDFVFKYMNYILRVEQMDKKYWWWCVYYSKEEIAFDDPTASTELEAKLLAELYFIKHLLTK